MRNQNAKKRVRPSAPHILHTFIVQSRPQDPLRTQYLPNFGVLNFRQCGTTKTIKRTLCHTIMLPGRKSGLRARFRWDSNRENLKIGPAAGLRPAGGPILMLSRLESGRNPARKPDFRTGSTIVRHRVGNPERPTEPSEPGST